MTGWPGGAWLAQSSPALLPFQFHRGPWTTLTWVPNLTGTISSSAE